MGLVTVTDEWTKLVGHRFLNSQICVWIGLIQMVVCIWGVAQHGYSYAQYSKILQCDFVSGSLPLEAVDAVIFDLGLFYSLWGIRGCVAEYIDGGFGRLCWCVSHTLSIVISLPFAFVSHPRPCFLWPLLIQQSAYGVCLLILFLAALPKILPLLTEPHAALLAQIGIYITGTTLNFFLTYVYWHWYWHVSTMWNTAVRVPFGSIVRNANNRSRRDRPNAPKEDVTFPEDPPIDYSPIPSLPPAITKLNGHVQKSRGSVTIITPVSSPKSKNGTIVAARRRSANETPPPPPKRNGGLPNGHVIHAPVLAPRRRSTVHYDSPPTSSPSDCQTPPPPIMATPLLPTAPENRHLRAQAAARSGQRRRQLPVTPDEPPFGECNRRNSTGRPVFFLPHSAV